MGVVNEHQTCRAKGWAMLSEYFIWSIWSPAQILFHKTCDHSYAGQEKMIMVVYVILIDNTPQHSSCRVNPCLRLHPGHSTLYNGLTYDLTHRKFQRKRELQNRRSLGCILRMTMTISST